MQRKLNLHDNKSTRHFQRLDSFQAQGQTDILYPVPTPSTGNKSSSVNNRLCVISVQTHSFHCSDTAADGDARTHEKNDSISLQTTTYNLKDSTNTEQF